MKTVKNLSVTVTYKVGIGNVEMPDNVYEQLLKAAKNNDEIDGVGNTYREASDWLSNHVKEGDCFDWKTEINQISSPH